MIDNKKQVCDNSKIKIHFFYVVFILSAIIVLLIVSNWTSIEGFTDYLTAAGTVVSIVLGVLAIIYSFVSGDTLSRSLGNVAAAADALQDARHELGVVLGSANNLTEKSEATSQNLSNLLSEIKGEVEHLNSVSSHLTTNNVELTKLIHKMPERLEQIDNRLDQALKGSSNNVPVEKVNENTPLAEQLIRYSSNFGAALLYACALSKEQDKSFTLKDGVLGRGGQYAYGFLIAAAAIDVLEFEVVDHDKNIYKATEFSLGSTSVLEIINDANADEDADGKENMSELIKEAKALFA